MVVGDDVAAGIDGDVQWRGGGIIIPRAQHGGAGGHGGGLEGDAVLFIAEGDGGGNGHDIRVIAGEVDLIADGAVASQRVGLGIAGGDRHRPIQFKARGAEGHIEFSLDAIGRGGGDGGLADGNCGGGERHFVAIAAKRHAGRHGEDVRIGAFEGDVVADAREAGQHVADGAGGINFPRAIDGEGRRAHGVGVPRAGGRVAGRDRRIAIRQADHVGEEGDRVAARVKRDTQGDSNRIFVVAAQGNLARVHRVVHAGQFELIIARRGRVPCAGSELQILGLNRGFVVEHHGGEGLRRAVAHPERAVANLVFPCIATDSCVHKFVFNEGVLLGRNVDCTGINTGVVFTIQLGSVTCPSVEATANENIHAAFRIKAIFSNFHAHIHGEGDRRLHFITNRLFIVEEHNIKRLRRIRRAQLEGAVAAAFPSLITDAELVL